MEVIKEMPDWYRGKKLGAGSYGTVYEVYKEENGKTYRAALKVISVPKDDTELRNAYSDGMDEQSAISYFGSIVNSISEECAVLYTLSGNTNIVSYQEHKIIPHENGVGADILIRMEFLTTLEDYIATNRIDEEMVIKLGADLCRALDICEKNNIIHRDIKPANIFVNQNGDFKLGDFGIARTLSQSGFAMSQKGTYRYMAPEVFKGSQYGKDVDLYSLGLVLYWCLNKNRLPFLPLPPEPLTATINDEALARRMKGEIIPAPAYGGKMIQQTVLKALEYESDRRYKTANEFRCALEGCYGEARNESIYGHTIPQSIERKNAPSKVDDDATPILDQKTLMSVILFSEEERDMNSDVYFDEDVEPVSNLEKTTGIDGSKRGADKQHEPKEENGADKEKSQPSEQKSSSMETVSVQKEKKRRKSGMIIRVLYPGHCSEIVLSEHDEYEIGSRTRKGLSIPNVDLHKVHVRLEKQKDQWYVACRGPVFLNGSKIEHAFLKPGQLYILSSRYRVSFFVVERVEAKPETVDISRMSSVTIGRTEENQIVIPHYLVSGKHAIIMNQGNCTEIIDQDSTNGTFVNGDAVIKHKLEDGDEIEIGDASLIYQAQTLRILGKIEHQCSK